MSSTQRNKYDVAMEMLKLHIEQSRNDGKIILAEELESLFQKYYRLADKAAREVH